MVATLDCATASYLASANGFYRNNDKAVQVRSLPSNPSLSAPASTEVFDTTLELVNGFVRQARTAGVSIAVTPGQTANGGAFISVNAGRFGSGRIVISQAEPVINGNTATIVNTITASGRAGQQIINRVVVVTEIFVLNGTSGIQYESSTNDPEFSNFNTGNILLPLVTVGTGTPSDPFVPPNPNWISAPVVISFPIALNGRPRSVDPPFANGFDYTVAENRSERIRTVVAPVGFGPRIRVFASPTRRGPLRFVGTVASGRRIELTRFPGLRAGAAKIRLKGMNPKPDLEERAPYPVGLGFRNITEGTAVVEVKALF